MSNLFSKIRFRWLYKGKFWSLLVFFLVVYFIRFTKGSVFLDFYSLLTRPLWPGPAQREWLVKANYFEHDIRLQSLEEDNKRLREILALKSSSGTDRISAAVISRSSKGWWHQLELNKGKKDGIEIGDAVIGPGGLLGLIDSTSFFTSRVQLLTSPGSKVGAWVLGAKRHGILIGLGTNRPKLTFFDKDSNAEVGDFVVTSPASTLLPPNLPIGTIKVINNKFLPSPSAIVQLNASPEAIDWVQVLKKL